MECWSNGVLQYCSIAVLERWSIGEEFTLLHHSATPLLHQLKVAQASRRAIIFIRSSLRFEATAGRQRCGCSSVVEHLLAKEDVASSSLVTRSSLRLERSGK
jgi:hypothetical protein